MSTNKVDLQKNEIMEMLEKHEFPSADIVLYQKNERVTDYLVDDRYILRISRSELSEKVRLEKVQSVMFVPKMHISGTFNASGENYHFIIIDFVKGEELLGVLQMLTLEQSIQIGKDIAKFLDDLHMVTDCSYDIGHYIPTIPRFRYSWRKGHLEYIESLRNSLSDLNLKVESKTVILSAFEYIRANADSLDYQSGPKFLHNDLHPKNIIINQGKLAGIIDWECSQYGEVDFEIVHLFHWGIYPSKPEERFDSILKSLFENYACIKQVPNIEKRLTIYQLEHELNQLIWSGMSQEELRIQRINGWLNNQIEDLLNNWSKK